MRDQRRAPRSVADPDRSAYDRSVRENARLQAEREMREADRSDSVADTADRTSDLLTAFQIAPATAGVFGDADALALARRLGKVFPYADNVLSLISATAGYKADRARGMPVDEAAMKNGGGLVRAKAADAGGTIFGAWLGANLGRPAGPEGVAAGGVIGGLLGGESAERLTGVADDHIAAGWRRYKRRMDNVRASWGDELRRLSSPLAWGGHGRR